MELDQLLERGTESMGRIIAGVRQEQFDNPTPCSEWSVRDLLNHVIGGNHFFAAIAAGERPDTTGPARDVVGDDPATAYAQGAKAALEAWRAPGTAERIVHMPMGDMPGAFGMGLHFIDHLVHSWDLAKATGQESLADPDLAEAALGLVKGNVGEELRQPGGPFGPEVPCADDAAPFDRLVAYLGRQP
ncbi:MAG: TIGR03086 family metal-binding protein [Actinomycetota bacterium]|nr:TIGR03086 family metal-binding protein [Actinomycetota bacterium]